MVEVKNSRIYSLICPAVISKTWQNDAPILNPAIKKWHFTWHVRPGPSRHDHEATMKIWETLVSTYRNKCGVSGFCRYMAEWQNRGDVKDSNIVCSDYAYLTYLETICVHSDVSQIWVVSISHCVPRCWCRRCWARGSLPTRWTGHPCTCCLSPRAAPTQSWQSPVWE